MKTIEIDGATSGPSPRREGFTRHAVTVTYAGSLYPAEQVWFEVPDNLATDLPTSGDPWLAAMLPLAVTLGRPLIVKLPVDRVLFEGAHRLMALWTQWYPELRPVAIETDLTEPAGDPSAEGLTALLFSGGVDSSYTLLSSENKAGLVVDELLLIHGFDISIDRQDAFDAVYQRLSKTIEPLGKPLIAIASNLRQTRFQDVNWTDLAHGAFLAAAGLLLSRRLQRVVISSGSHPGHFVPAGTHPDTDPLFSTSRTTIVHFGAGTSRMDKLAFLSEHPAAFHNLRLCYHAETGANCGRCLKCLIATSILEVMGKLAECQSFPNDRLDLDHLSRIYLVRAHTIFRLIQAYAAQNGREDVAKAIDAGFQRTERLNRGPVIGWLSRLRRRYRHHANLRLVSRTARRWLYAFGMCLNRFAN